MLSGIAVNLITGRDAALKSRLLEHLIALRPAGARWAVLVNEAGVATAQTAAANPDVFFSELAQGCICCTAQLPLRVALTRLLRESAPGRLFIFAPGGARTRGILAMLSDRWLSPVLSVHAIIHVLAPDEVQTLSGDDILAGQLAAAQVVVIDDGAAYNASALQSLVPGNAPLIRRLRPEAIDLALLDLPGVMPRPRFYGTANPLILQQGRE